MITGELAVRLKSASGAPARLVFHGAVRASGPQLMLTKLLPSSTVAFAVKLKTGFGTYVSLVPGGTL